MQPGAAPETDQRAQLAAIAQKAGRPRQYKAATSHYLPLPLIPGGFSRLLFSNFMFSAFLGLVQLPLGAQTAFHVPTRR